MSSQNNDNSGAYAGIAFVLAGLYVVALLLFALAAFAAFVLTIMCLMAWRTPLHLGKDTVITPEEARAFVKRGIIGAFLAPVFAIFAGVLFQFPIRDDALGYIVIAGYVGGSLILEMMMHNQKEEEEKAQQTTLMTLPPSPPPSDEQHRPGALMRAPEEFRFASWDDEEEFDERS